jgi:hypothetical protein
MADTAYCNPTGDAGTLLSPSHNYSSKTRQTSFAFFEANHFGAAATMTLVMFFAPMG